MVGEVETNSISKRGLLWCTEEPGLLELGEDAQISLRCHQLPKSSLEGNKTPDAQ